MELKDLDFSRCRYNPLAKTFVRNMERAIPAFAEYDGKLKRNVFQYVVILHDKQSPLWAKEPQYFQRKVLAATLSGLSAETKGGSLSGWTREVMEGADDKVNSLITAFVTHEGDVEYTTLIAELIMYSNLFLQQIGGVPLDDKQYKLMISLLENIKQRTRIVFGSGQEDELIRVRNLLYKQAEKDRYQMNPEAIAKMLSKDGDFPNDWCPYGVKYEIEPLSFHKDDTQGES